MPTTSIDGPLIAVAGDWHGNTSWAVAAIAALPSEVTNLIHLGDFGFMGRDIDDYLDAVQSAACQANVEIWVVPGNHEDYDWLAGLPVDRHGRGLARRNILALPRGFRFQFGRHTVCAVGGAVSIDQAWRTFGVDWWPQEAITKEEAETVINGGPCDILLTHDLPQGAPCPGIDPDVLIRNVGVDIANQAYLHRWLIRDIVFALKPAQILHGHMHTRYTSTVTWEPGGDLPFQCTINGLARDGMDGNMILLGPDATVFDIAR